MPLRACSWRKPYFMRRTARPCGTPTAEWSSTGFAAPFGWLWRLPQHRAAGVHCLIVQLLFDAQKLVVFGKPVGAGERSGLDLPAIGRHGEIGDGGVFRFPRAVGHHRAI